MVSHGKRKPRSLGLAAGSLDAISVFVVLQLATLSTSATVCTTSGSAVFQLSLPGAPPTMSAPGATACGPAGCGPTACGRTACCPAACGPTASGTAASGPTVSGAAAHDPAAPSPAVTGSSPSVPAAPDVDGASGRFPCPCRDA